MEDPSGIGELYKGKTKLSDFIITIPDSLDPNFCDKVIEKYQKNKEDEINATTLAGYQPEFQKRRMIEISKTPHWKEEDSVFSNALEKEINQAGLYFESSEVQDRGYLLTHQDKTGYYHWHHDGHWEGRWNRFYTFIWYLNTLKDGCTEFLFGEKIYPEAGKLLLFPANPLFVHRSVKASVDKFICTGWLYTTHIDVDNG